MSNAYRLPRSVVPHHYAIELEPDLDTASFNGRARIEVEIEESTAVVSLNAVDLDIDRAVVERGGDTTPLRVELDPDAERLHLHSHGELPPGSATIEIVFRGVLNDKLRGFYRSTYTDDTGAPRVLATTQFEATDARRAFPCWDEPDFKATFAITLVVAAGLAAVSNARELSSTPTGDGRRRVEFATTMPMSTYLVAFIVGPLSVTATVDVDGTPVRVVTRPDRVHLAAFALDVAAFALRYFAEYFDYPYPSDKLDLVAIPDFAFGAMENLGCVTFRETALLVDPDASSQPELQRVVDVIAHELAHMWFGDLVTMRWWNGIWLNEAFATFMEMKATDAFRPEWQRWTDFGLSRTAAFDVDSLSSTRPIEFEVVSPRDAEAMFDVLTYEKGAAVVRMLELYLGEDRFREGIRRYMRAHEHGNTETSDLWDAIEAATGEPIRRIMESWIFQGGYPVVTAAIEGASLTLSQSRFRYADDNGAERWSIPIRLRVGAGAAVTDRRLLLEDGSTRVDLPTDLATGVDRLVLNVDSSGFYRAALPDALVSRLAQNGPAEMSPIERYSLIDDAWALTVAGRADLAQMIALFEGFAAEDDLSVWQRIAGALDSVWRVAAPPDRVAVKQWIIHLVEPAYRRATQEVATSDRTRQLRATLFSTLGRLADHEPTIDRARAIARDGDDDPALVAAALVVAATHGTVVDHRDFSERLLRATSPQEEERLRVALTEFSDVDAFDTTLAMCADDRLRTQDAPYVLGRALQNRFHGFRGWRFLEDHWDQNLARFPSNSLSRMLAGIVALAEPDQAAAVEAFLRDHPVPVGVRQVDQHRERLAVAATFRQRERPRLGAGLARSYAS